MQRSSRHASTLSSISASTSRHCAASLGLRVQFGSDISMPRGMLRKDKDGRTVVGISCFRISGSFDVGKQTSLNTPTLSTSMSLPCLTSESVALSASDTLDYFTRCQGQDKTVHGFSAMPLDALTASTLVSDSSNSSFLFYRQQSSSSPPPGGFLSCPSPATKRKEHSSVC